MAILVLVVLCDLSTVHAITGQDIDLLTLSSPRGFKILGAGAGDIAGSSVSAAGDINGDGVGDVIIGARAADPSTLAANSNGGVAYIIFGRRNSNAADVNLQTMIAGRETGFRILGAAAGDGCGYSVSAAGDINGDGLDDVIVGASFANPGTAAGAGAAYVIYGRNVTSTSAPFQDINLATLSNTVGFRIWGGASGDNAGNSVSAAGDVNGDGIADVIVAALAADPPTLPANSDAGMVYIIFGRKVGGSVAPFADMHLSADDGTNGFRILGATGADLLGFAVGKGGDVNGDGVDDVIVAAIGQISGSAGITYVVFGRKTSSGGSTTVFSDVNLASIGTAGFRIFGAAAGDRSGYSVRTAGDINGDGVNDIMTGALLAAPLSRTYAGCVYIIYGRKVGVGVPAFTDIHLSTFNTSSTTGFRLIGGRAVDNTGIAVSDAGDVNGDGITDMIVGAQGVDTLNTSPVRGDVGASYVIFGRKIAQFADVDLSTIVSGSTVGFRIIGGATGDYNGCSVSAAGDVNGDGIADVIVGSCNADPTTLPANSDAGMAYVVYGAISEPTSQPSSQPSRRPTGQPTRQPSSHPTSQPVGRPTSQPSTQPTSQPSQQPLSRPSMQPSVQPTAQPSRHPSSQPTAQPTGQPVDVPTSAPSSQPFPEPSAQPSSVPSMHPTAQPSSTPSSSPSVLPSVQPSTQPTTQPSTRLTEQPIAAPSTLPSSQPSNSPSAQPSTAPSVMPTAGPSGQPSLQPTIIPTYIPTSQPSTEPTAVPSLRPTADPTTQPTGSPSSQPTDWPSGIPTDAPTSQPSVQPSVQPTSVPSAAPTVLPSYMPTGVPSGQPSGDPSAQPTYQPSIQPSGQPTRQPSSHPSQQPMSAPSARPTLRPTGEWTLTIDTRAQLTRVEYIANYVWACGHFRTEEGTFCVEVDVSDGDSAVRKTFSWDAITAVLSSGASANAVIMGGRTTGAESVSSDIATCSVALASMTCSVQSFANTNFIAGSYLAYPNKVVFVGPYSTYTSATILSLSASASQSYIYTPYNLKSVVLSQIRSPPNFIGSFVAGTCARSTGASAIFIMAGMIRTDTGAMTLMTLYPVDGSILSSTDLVTAMTMEYTRPDSFIGGGLQIEVGGVTSAYMMRVSALFDTQQYCMRYSTRTHADSRRALSDAAPQTIMRALVLVEAVVFAVSDYVESWENKNMTSVVVLKLNADTGAIIQQARIGSLYTNVLCTDIAAAGQLLTVLCNIGSNASSMSSVLIAMDAELSLAALPVGIVRMDNDTLEAEDLPMALTVVSVTKALASAAVSTYEFNSADSTPTRKPSAAPTVTPSSQPSSAPSAQPSSCPTAAPSVSARPTSQPSTASPTNTFKPTVTPTDAPTAQPVMIPTTGPTVRPTARPTAKPSQRPMPSPSRAPTVQATTRPSIHPTAVRTPSPSVCTTRAPSRPFPSFMPRSPSAPPTVLVNSAVGNQRDAMPPHMVLIAVGSGVGLIIFGYFGYKYYQKQTEAKDREKRLVVYYLEQAALIENNQRAREAEEVREDTRRAARRAERAARRQSERELAMNDEEKARRAQGARMGAYFNAPHLSNTRARSDVSSASSASVAISSLHTSELDSQGSGAPSEQASFWSRSAESDMEEGSATHSSALSEFADYMLRDTSESLSGSSEAGSSDEDHRNTPSTGSAENSITHSVDNVDVVSNY